MNLFTALHVFFYKASGGRIGGRFRGAPVLLLTTVGRRTGKKRTTPLLYVREEENNGNINWALVASNGGRSQDPSWWANLQRNPNAEIQIKGEKRGVRARKASDDEKTRLWPILTKMYPSYNDYQKKTTRNIPVVILEESKPVSS